MHTMLARRDLLCFLRLRQYPDRSARHKNPISQDIHARRDFGIRARRKFPWSRRFERTRFISRIRKSYHVMQKCLIAKGRDYISRRRIESRDDFGVDSSPRTELWYYLSKRNTIQISMHSNEYSSRPLDRFISNQRHPLRRYQRFPRMTRSWQDARPVRRHVEDVSEKRSNFAGSLARCCEMSEMFGKASWRKFAARSNFTPM